MKCLVLKPAVALMAFIALLLTPLFAGLANLQAQEENPTEVESLDDPPLAETSVADESDLVENESDRDWAEEETDGDDAAAAAAGYVSPVRTTNPRDEVTEERPIEEIVHGEGGYEHDMALSPKNWTFHAGFGAYKLRYIDDEFDTSSPSKDIFGDKLNFTFQLGLERFLWQGFGTVGIEAAFGYFQAKGKGLFPDGTKSSDTTKFNMMPFKLSGVYRFSNVWEDYGVPLVPYAKLGLDYHIWWITDQGGSVSSYEKAGGGEAKGYGGTFGFHVSYGLQFCLDIIDRRLANEFDHDVGVNNTYLYAEGTFAKINDFWIGDSFDLSDHHFLVGLLFEF